MALNTDADRHSATSWPGFYGTASTRAAFNSDSVHAKTFRWLQLRNRDLRRNCVSITLAFSGNKKNPWKLPQMRSLYYQSSRFMSALLEHFASANNQGTLPNE
jgi:hypothetical protein